MKIISSIEQKLGQKYVRFFRFVLIGGFVTILSLILSYVFLKIIGTPLIITYISLYIFTIFISYLLNSYYTFRAKRDIKSLLLFYGSYIFTLALGTACLTLMKKWLPFENWVLAFMVIPITMITNFTLSSLIFKKR